MIEVQDQLRNHLLHLAWTVSHEVSIKVRESTRRVFGFEEGAFFERESPWEQIIQGQVKITLGINRPYMMYKVN